MPRLLAGPGPRLAALALLMLTPAAFGQLIGLTHDSAGEVSILADIDAASAVTVIGAGDSSLEVAYGASALNPFTETVFALGPDPLAADGTTALFAFDIATGARTEIGNTGSSERVAALRFELSTQRLVAALSNSDASTLRLVEVDPTSAALTEINAGIIDCCALTPGVAESRAGELLLVGRGTADPVDERYLIALSTTGDDQVSQTLLDAPVAALGWDRLAGQLYGVVQTPTGTPAAPQMELVEILADGSLAAVGTPIDDCCILAPGIGVLAVNSQTWYLVASDVATAALGVFAFNLSDGTAAQPGTLPAGITVNNLFDPLSGLTPSTTTIDSIDPSPVTVGDSFVVTATVSSSAAIDGGQITISDGTGNDCSIIAPSGSCSLPTSQAGTLLITANFSGTTTLGPSQDTANQNVDSAPSNTSVASVTPSPSQIGQAYSVSASVTGFGAPTGTIDVDDGQGETCQIVLPATNCSLNAPTVGPRTITAAYSGDVNNLPSQDTAGHEVVPAASSTSIDSIVPSPTEIGDAYAVSVSVAGFGTPTGIITVDDGEGASCTITLPDAGCSLTSSAAGNLVITASYSGDTNNEPSADTAPHTVEPATTTTLITDIDPSPSPAGQAYTVTVDVTGFGTPEGTVTVSDDQGATCTVTLPGTECDLVSNVIGTRTITADYSGDDVNQPSSDSASQTITLAQTALALTASSTVVVQGGQLLLLASLDQAASPTTGTVSFETGGNVLPGCGAVVVANDQATCTGRFDSIGVFTISADYSGDDNNAPASDTLQIQVNPIAVPTMSNLALVLLALMMVLVAVRRPGV